MSRIYSKSIGILISFFFLIFLSGCAESGSPFKKGRRYVIREMVSRSDSGIPRSWEKGTEIEIFERWVILHFKDGESMIINRDEISTIVVSEITQ